MSTRSYRGNRGKNVYEIANFSKGVNATNAAMPPGYLKELVNMNISPDGLSLRPREPYLNYALYLKGNNNKNEFVTLSNRVGMFVSKQFPNWEFIIDFFGTRRGYEKVIEDYRIIDGDTFVDNKTGIRYRLLIVDAYELGTEEGQEAKEFVENLLDGKPITVRYDSQAPSWVDQYNRHLVWAYTTLADATKGLNIQKELIDKKHAKYLDLRVTEHQFNILNNEFGGLPDYDGNTLVVEGYPGGIPVVYRRDINQPPVLINKRPCYILHEFNNIFMGDMLNDLEIGYSFVPDIRINKVNSEFGRYRTEYNPLEQNKMTNHDGIVALVDIDPYPPVEIVDAINLYISLVPNLAYSKNVRSFSSSLELAIGINKAHVENKYYILGISLVPNLVYSKNVRSFSLNIGTTIDVDKVHIEDKDYSLGISLVPNLTYSKNVRSFSLSLEIAVGTNM